MRSKPWVSRAYVVGGVAGMRYIHSKDIFHLLRDTLKLFDRRPMDHGGKVAYYVYMMLKCKGGLEKYELADIAFLVTFHDIGAYRTDDIDQMLRYETKDYHAHSLYGKLFLENLTATGDLSTVILNHHTDYTALKGLNAAQSELASYISLAEAIDIYKGSLGEKFSLDIFSKKAGSKFSPSAFNIFCQANEEYNLFDKINSKVYKEELRSLMEFFILTNEEKEQYMLFMMYILSLKSDFLLKNAATCVALCEKLGALMKRDSEQQANLKYAAYLHDIGYLAFRKEWIEDTAKLSLAQMEKLAHHTIFTEQLLKGRVKREIIVIASAHHERADGSGYPRRLTGKQMNLDQLILQFADAVSGTVISGANNEIMLEKIKKQANAGWFSSAVTKVFFDKFDEIIVYTEERVNDILEKPGRINQIYNDKILRASRSE